MEIYEGSTMLELRIVLFDNDKNEVYSRTLGEWPMAKVAERRGEIDRLNIVWTAIATFLNAKGNAESLASEIRWLDFNLPTFELLPDYKPISVQQQEYGTFDIVFVNEQTGKGLQWVSDQFAVEVDLDELQSEPGAPAQDSDPL